MSSNKAVLRLLLVAALWLPAPAQAWWSPASGSAAVLTADAGEGAWVPTLPIWTTTGPAFSSQTILTATDLVAACGVVPKTGTLNGGGMFWNAITQDPAAGITYSFQDPSATTGDPDGSADQFNGGINVAAGWIETGLSADFMTDDGTDTGVKRSVTIGQLLCLVAGFTTFGAGDSIAAGAIDVSAFSFSNQNARMFSDLNNATVWTKNQDLISAALIYNDGSYGLLGTSAYPPTTFTNDTDFDTGTTPDEQCLRFIPAVDMTVDGIAFRGDLDNDADLVLYDSGNSVVGTTSMDDDIRGTTGTGTYEGRFAAVNLTGGAIYRACVKPTTASDVQFSMFAVTSVAAMAALPGGVEWYFSHRTDAGAWTDVTTTRPWIQIHRTKGLGD